MKRLYVLVFLIFAASSGFSQLVTLSGHIKDKASGEALIGATCYIPHLVTGVISNAYGFYSITVPKGTYKISFSYIGYVQQDIQLELKENKLMSILLPEDTKQIEEVLVTGEKKDRNV